MTENQPLNPEHDNKGMKAGIFAPEHTVAFYTLVSILLKMKNELGLEAMLEYMSKYLSLIDSHNPKITTAVGKALHVLPVELIFHELTKYDKPN